MKNFMYIVFLLITFMSYFIIKKYYTNKDPQSFSQPRSKEVVIDRAAAIKLFNRVKNSEVLGATLGVDVDGPEEFREKSLCIGFGPFKEFEINGNKELNYSWFIGITWFWAMYDTDKKERDEFPQELCAMGTDDVTKIEKYISMLEGKKLTSIVITDAHIELLFEHIMILIIMPEEDIAATIVGLGCICFLCTPDDEVLQIISRDKILVQTS